MFVIGWACVTLAPFMLLVSVGGAARLSVAGVLILAVDFVRYLHAHRGER